jgi:uncharacterized membrane protein YfcA
LLSEILGTIGGFGSSLFFVPIASYFLDFHSVLGVTALFHISSNLSKIALFRNGFDKKIIISMGIPAVLFVIAGAIISKFIQIEFLEVILSLFLIVISVALLLLTNFSVKPSTSNNVAGGIVSGFFAGLLGTGGAIRGAVLSPYNLNKQVFIATSAIIDLAIDSSRSVVYYLNGYVRSEILHLIPLLFVVSLIGTWIGKKTLAFISDTQFKKIVLGLVLITGVVTLIKVISRYY